VPLALLPFHAAAVLLAVGSLVAIALALWVLGVRDWRCYGVVYGSIAVITAVRLGTLTPLLLLFLALAWRYRDRRWIVGASLAAAVVLKLFLWPLVVWLVATRRFAAAALAAVLATATTLVAWAAIGFAGFGQYPELLRRLNDVVAGRGFSLVALGSDIGLGGTASHILPWVVGGAVLVVAALAARAADGDRRAFALSVAASILLSPIVWLHYFVLLYVPIALWRRSLSAAWLVPLLFWFVPFQETHGHAWRVAIGLAIAVMALTAAAHRPAPGGRAA
jgi:alpha-1,2-mannosyltransferase